MSERYTRKHAESAFGILVRAVNGKVAESWDEVGAYRLDYNGVYGGYNVERIYNDGGAVSQPFGAMRRPAREFVEAVRFATDAIEEAKRNA